MEWSLIYLTVPDLAVWVKNKQNGVVIVGVACKAENCSRSCLFIYIIPFTFMMRYRNWVWLLIDYLFYWSQKNERKVDACGVWDLKTKKNIKISNCITQVFCATHWRFCQYNTVIATIIMITIIIIMFSTLGTKSGIWGRGQSIR